MVLGILSIFTWWGFGGVVMAILAIVFAARDSKQRQEVGRPKNGMATAGLVTGILGLIFSVLVLLLILAAIASSGS